MSYFGEELTRQMTAKSVTGLQLAARIGLSAAQVSKWTRGEQTSVDDVQLSAIQRALSDDPHDHARLVLAHLLDEKFGLHHSLVEVSMRSDFEVKDRPRHRSKGDAAIEFLAEERVRNPELNDMLIDLARLLQPAKPKSK